MEEFIATTGSDVSWRYASRTRLIDYALAIESLHKGLTLKLVSPDTVQAWRKRATLLQGFQLRGVKVMSRCKKQDDGSYEILIKERQEDNSSNEVLIVERQA